MNTPAVSVLIDTYNHERYIEQAIVSVLEQDFPASDMEIVVVDDGSTDRTPEIVGKFAPRVRHLRKKNGGQASAFNAAIPQLRGEIISFLDGDDWFAPGKLTTVMSALEQHPEASAVGHGHYMVHPDRDEVWPSTQTGAKFVHMSTPTAARQAFSSWRSLLMGALTGRKEVLQRAIPIPSELVFCADTAFMMTAMAGGAWLLEQPLFYYRRHADNLHAVDPADLAKRRRRDEMNEKKYGLIEPLLVSLNVTKEALAATLYPSWTELSRSNLRTYGGSRLRTLKTEMRQFRLQYPNPTVPHRLYKYLVGGGAMLLLPPRAFYRLQEWSARPGLNRVRKILFGMNRTPA